MAHQLAPNSPAAAEACGEAVASAAQDEIARTRAGLARRLRSSPAGALLTPYFHAGKLLRARLVFAAAATAGAPAEAVRPAAEAIELLHGASLLHDDVIDGAAMRRGLPAVHERLGTDAAIVLGDDLLLMAFAALGEARSRHGAERVLDATALLTRCARQCCRGQYGELTADGDVDVDRYLEIVRGKTASQFVAAVSLGALLGGAGGAVRGRLTTGAEQMGIAFQIRDDLLDLVGDARALGKPTGNSIALGRPSLPLVLLQRMDAAAAAQAVRCAGQPGWTPGPLAALLDRLGVLDEVRRLQHACVDRALAALSPLPAGPGVDALRELARRAGAAPQGASGTRAPPAAGTQPA